MAQQPPPGNYPPPPGGQYPPPGGQPPPPGGFPPPGGQPPPPGGFPPPPQGPGFGQKAAKAGGGIVVRIVIGIVVIGVLALGGWIIKNLTGDTDTAATGDCVTDSTNADDIKVVECTDPEAAYTVTMRDDDPDQLDSEASCASVEYEFYLEAVKGSTTEYVLCLNPLS